MTDSATGLDTLGSALQQISELLDASGVCFGHGTDSAWDEAVQLVFAAAGLDLDADVSHLNMPLSEHCRDKVTAFMRQRIEHRVPLPYILGRAYFAGLEFICDRRALVPRSPLAELILNAFQPWLSGPPPERVLDLCCGGGCIGLAVAHYFPDAEVDLADIDAAALSLAAENREQLKLSDRCELFEADVFAGLPLRDYDLILSNPPYVDAVDLAAMPAEFRHEPPLGLGSGAEGLDITHRILKQARTYLSDRGLLIVEVGNGNEALERAYPRVPFTWIEFEHGGHGVFVLSASELQEYDASWRG